MIRKRQKVSLNESQKSRLTGMNQIPTTNLLAVFWLSLNTAVTITSISISNKPKPQSFPFVIVNEHMQCPKQLAGLRNCISAFRVYESITRGVIDVTVKMQLNQSCVGARKRRYGWIGKKRERERENMILPHLYYAV